MNATDNLSKPSGLKEKVRDALLGSLRRQVEDQPDKPGLAQLKDKQQDFLLDNDQINQYVLMNQKSDPAHPVHQALVDYLRFKVGDKPKRVTLERVHNLQQRCLLTDKELKKWVIDWWEKRKKG